MTHMKLALDIIDYRKGTIDINELHALMPTWDVPREYALFEIEHAKAHPIHQKTGDLFA